MRKQFMTKRNYRPTLERLEDRTLPAMWGMAWPNPQHITVSFVPDGTAVGSAPSTLFQTLNSQAATSVWEMTILQALKTWTANANMSLALVNDGGQPIGSSGMNQGDSRFGDIRVAAVPLGSDVVAITAPYDLLAGTRAGDILLNSSDFGSSSAGLYDLYTVVLHEAGHSFGFADQTSDPTSVMYAQYTGVRAGLSPADVSLVQSLYGARRPDSFEAPLGDDTFATAATVNVPYIGADITNSGDVDIYKYAIPTYGSSTLSLSVQTSNISLLTPRLTVYNAMQQALNSVVSTDPLHGDIALTISNVIPGATYYFKVEGARPDVFGMGTYALKINSSNVAPVMITNFATVYQNLMLNLSQADFHTNDTIATATNLDQAPYVGSSGFNRAIKAAIEDSSDVDTYKIVAQPISSGAPSTIVATVSAVDGSALSPHINVFDQNGVLIQADILVNDHGTYLVQIANATPNAVYYVQVSADAFAGANNTGSYLLGVNYLSTPIVLTQFDNNTLSGASNQSFDSMTVSQTQITHFVLSASSVGALVPTAVRMSIYDQNGNIIFTLDAMAGQTISSNVYLQQGTYIVRFVAATFDSSALSSLVYNLRGETLTDPIDAYPVNPSDPTLPPPPPPNPTPLVVATTPPSIPLPDFGSTPWAPLLPPPPPPPPPTGITGL